MLFPLLNGTGTGVYLPVALISTFRLSFQQTNVRKGVTFTNFSLDFFHIEFAGNKALQFPSN